MKLTVLEMVQSIGSSMNSDEINSISDTTESMQIAEIVKTSYFNIIVRANIPEQRVLFQLDPSLVISQPNLMYIPSGIKKIEWLKYYDADTDATQYKYVTLLPIQQFADYVNTFDPSQSFVETMNLTIDSEVFLFRYRNDLQPTYATVLSNYYVVFDSYNAALDSTLEGSKTECYGFRAPTWTMSDSFIPELDDQQFPLLLNEAKSLAFFELKQTPHSKAEQEAKRQWTSLQRDKSVDDKPSSFDALPNFGRKSVYWRGPIFKW